MTTPLDFARILMTKARLCDQPVSSPFISLACRMRCKYPWCQAVCNESNAPQGFLMNIEFSRAKKRGANWSVSLASRLTFRCVLYKQSAWNNNVLLYMIADYTPINTLYAKLTTKGTFLGHDRPNMRREVRGSCGPSFIVQIHESTNTKSRPLLAAPRRPLRCTGQTTTF